MLHPVLLCAHLCPFSCRKPIDFLELIGPENVYINEHDAVLFAREQIVEKGLNARPQRWDTAYVPEYKPGLLTPRLRTPMSPPTMPGVINVSGRRSQRGGPSSGRVAPPTPGLGSYRQFKSTHFEIDALEFEPDESDPSDPHGLGPIWERARESTPRRDDTVSHVTYRIPHI